MIFLRAHCQTRSRSFLVDVLVMETQSNRIVDQTKIMCSKEKGCRKNRFLIRLTKWKHSQLVLEQKSSPAIRGQQTSYFCGVNQERRDLVMFLCRMYEKVVSSCYFSFLLSLHVFLYVYLYVFPLFILTTTCPDLLSCLFATYAASSTS